jgi:RNA polymerase sigma-70 factor (ECF subfamily)
VLKKGDKTQELVILAKGGDESALERLYRVYGERVRWMVRFRMGKALRSRLESMDLVQDVFVNAFGAIEDFTYKNEGDFVRWLSKIAQNTLANNWDKLHAAKRDIRKEHRFRSHNSATDGALREVKRNLDATTPSVIMSKQEDLAKLEKAIDELKPQYRDIVVLSKIEGLSYKDIGKKLGKSPDAVRMLMPSAMAELTTVFMRM